MRTIRGVSAKLLAALLLVGTPTLTGDTSDAPRPTSAYSFEPARALDLSARTLSRIDLSSTTRVTIEVSVRSRLELPTVQIDGALLGGPGFDEVFGIPPRVLAIGRERETKIRYVLELDRGHQHHLVFSAQGDSPPESKAYLRVNFDPKLEPEDRGDVLQYRAKMNGGNGP